MNAMAAVYAATAHAAFVKHGISFVLPLYNEREAIGSTLRELCSLAEELTDDYEIIPADDGSTDGSWEIIQREAKRNAAIKPVRLTKNSHFGGALALGLRHASKELIIYTDSDLPVSAGDIKKSLCLIHGADIVTATSTVRKGENGKRKCISQGYNFLLRLLFRMPVRDANSGYKIFRRSALCGMSFSSQSPFIDAEIFLKALKRKAKIVEYPLVFQARRHGVSKIARLPVILHTFRDMILFRLAG